IPAWPISQQRFSRSRRSRWASYPPFRRGRRIVRPAEPHRPYVRQSCPRSRQLVTPKCQWRARTRRQASQQEFASSACCTPIEIRLSPKGGRTDSIFFRLYGHILAVRRLSVFAHEGVRSREPLQRKLTKQYVWKGR